ncbi:MAG: cell division protein FtsA [Spirochaetes bacterium]|nr:cell division protein FtsA [Spirochaetota bacterium]
MDQPFVASLDIGTTKVCVLIARQNADGALEVMGVGIKNSIGVQKGMIVNIDQTVESIRKAVEDAELQAGVEVTELHTGIAGGLIEGINSKAVIAVSGRGGEQEITMADIERVVAAAQGVTLQSGREVLHVLPQEFRVDDQDGILDPKGMLGSRLEVHVHIVTCQKSTTANIRRAVSLAGYQVADIVLQPIASAEAILNEDEKELGAVVIDIGGGTTDILMYIANSIWSTHVIPLGGSNVTSDIAYGLRTPKMSAELLKKQFGSAVAEGVEESELIQVPIVGDQEAAKVPKRMLAQIIEPRLEEIFAQVKTALEKTGYLDKIGAGVVLTGGASQCDGTAQLARRVLNMPVRSGRPRRLAGLADKVAGPEYATVTGLARYALSQGGEEASGHKRGPGDGEKGGFRRFLTDFFS